MTTTFQEAVALVQPLCNIAGIIYDIIYGRTAGLVKKSYAYGQADNYQQMVFCGVLAAINIAFAVIMAFVIAPWFKAIIVAKYTASPIIAMIASGLGKSAVSFVFGWIVDATNRNFL